MDFHSLFKGLYDAMSRVIWSIALCYVILACVYNYGGPINWFLSHPLWQPLSKLSYSICLIHYPILKLTLFTTKSLPHFNELTINYNFISAYILCIGVAIVVTLAIEAPLITMTKMIFDNGHNGLQSEKASKKDT